MSIACVLANFCIDGDGVDMDLAKGFQLLKRAADCGLLQATKRMAEMYELV